MTDEASKPAEELHDARMERYSIATLLIVSWALAVVVVPTTPSPELGNVRWDR
jgi:hypothetical protein